jgi:hypothetical protein
MLSKSQIKTVGLVGLEPTDSEETKFTVSPATNYGLHPQAKRKRKRLTV